MNTTETMALIGAIAMSAIALAMKTVEVVRDRMKGADSSRPDNSQQRELLQIQCNAKMEYVDGAIKEIRGDLADVRRDVIAVLSAQAERLRHIELSMVRIATQHEREDRNERR